MQDELNQISRNKVWTLVPTPCGKTIIGSKWVFRNKRDETGIVIKNKARLVAQGYNQQEGIDYDENFASVARLESIRIFLTFATYMNFIVYQMDIKSAFLNGKLKEEFYVKQPLGFESNEFPNHIKQSERSISINQEKYVKDLLKKYDINGSSVNTPMVPPNNLGPDLSGKAVNETQYRGMIGSLMYLTASRLDIQFSTCLCTRYQANPKESHLIAVKIIFRYLKGTPSLGLWYLKCSGYDLKGYSDSDYAGCNMDRNSTTGACQLLGGKLMCWSAKKQQSVVMSSAEAEYVAAAGCCANILWMKSQLTNYDIIYEKVPVFCDNTSAIAISNNPVLHSRTKQIDIKYHFIRDHILKGDIELHFIPTQYQLADIFTKPLDEPTFKRLIVELGKKPRAKSGLRRKQSSKHTSESKTEAYKSITGQSKKETQSSSAKDKSPIHHSPLIPVVGEIHKEAQQAADGPTSLGATSEEGAHPQLSSDMSVFLIIEPVYSSSFIFTLSLHQDGMDEGTKNYLIDHIFTGTNPSVLVDQTKSARDGLKITNTDSDESEEEETEKDEDTHATSHDLPEDTSFPHPPSQKSAQIQELMAQVHLLQSYKKELEQQKTTAEAKVASLKARHSYPDINQLTDLLNIQWELPAEFQALPVLVSLVQKKLKTWNSLPSLLNKVTETLNRYRILTKGQKPKPKPSTRMERA
ncbi:retrovirus-related pol polyprotein from transposon TNT 1-94 [Tanacetum coccineum]